MNVKVQDLSITKKVLYKPEDAKEKFDEWVDKRFEQAKLEEERAGAEADDEAEEDEAAALAAPWPPWGWAGWPWVSPPRDGRSSDGRCRNPGKARARTFDGTAFFTRPSTRSARSRQATLARPP